MRFNPQLLMQMMMQKNPNMMQQFNQFKQMMQSNPQMQQQYMQFKNEAINNPQKQEQLFNEAMTKVSGTTTPTKHG